MKAIRIHAFGGPEVLQLEEVARPVPAPDEILVKVHASGINPVDRVVREGSGAAIKYGLTLPMTLGWDAAGVVAAVGREVTGFQPGDAVYGVPNFPGNGSYAEYCSAKASQFALKPTSLGFLEAAAVPLAGLTAWTALFAYGHLQAGHRILIQGAAGGVGSLAVQFAKAKGAYVIGTASAGDLNYLRQLGADEVIDYQNQPFEDVVHDVDVVLEASSVRDNAERVKAITVLKAGGIFVSVNTDYPFDEAVQVALGQKGATGELSANQPRQEWLAEMAQLIDAGQVKVLVGKVFPLAQVAEAHRESQTGHVRGKLVLEVRQKQQTGMGRFTTISEFHAFLQLPPPLHPLLSVVDVSTILPRDGEEPTSMVFDFYSIAVKRMGNVRGHYGQHPFDFNEGVLSFMAPSQVFSLAVVDSTKEVEKSGWVVYIHPDFIWNTPLAKTIQQHDFWNYSLKESLFLSAREEATILNLLFAIRQEYASTIDRFSKPIIVSQVENLLHYADRFYHRQFLTREKANHEVLDRLEAMLHNYFNSDTVAERGLPTVQYVADCLQLSPKYLSNLLRLVTGQNTQQHIHTRLIAKAKEKLSTTALTVSEIAYQLGFEHVPSFSKLFKAKTNLSPLEFRASFT